MCVTNYRDHRRSHHAPSPRPSAPAPTPKPGTVVPVAGVCDGVPVVSPVDPFSVAQTADLATPTSTESVSLLGGMATADRTFSITQATTGPADQSNAVTVMNGGVLDFNNGAQTSSTLTVTYDFASPVDLTAGDPVAPAVAVPDPGAGVGVPTEASGPSPARRLTLKKRIASATMRSARS